MASTRSKTSRPAKKSTAKAKTAAPASKGGAKTGAKPAGKSAGKSGVKAGAQAAGKIAGRAAAIKAPASAAPTTFSRRQIIDLIVTLLNEADAHWFEEVANQVLIPKIRHVEGDSFVQVFDER